MKPVRIDRCICRDVLFSDLKTLALEKQVRDLRELQKIICFGDHCRLCHPYVREMLDSGTVVFGEIIHEKEESPGDL